VSYVSLDEKEGECMKFFQFQHSIAGIMQPGDATRYEFVAIACFDCIEVIVRNDEFFDKITFIPNQEEPYRTHRDAKTNPWTIKAAMKMRDMMIGKITLKEAMEMKL
jgi:hypothetical protein